VGEFVIALMGETETARRDGGACGGAPSGARFLPPTYTKTASESATIKIDESLAGGR